MVVDETGVDEIGCYVTHSLATSSLYLSAQYFDSGSTQLASFIGTGSVVI